MERSEADNSLVAEIDRLRARNRELEVAAANAEHFRYSEEMYRRIMEASQDCVKILDLDGTLILMSANGQRIREIDNIVPLIGKHWTSFWPAEAADAINDAVAAAGTGKVARFSAFCPTAKGTPKHWDVTVSPILNAAGRPERLLTVSRDISESVAAEAAVTTLNRALAQHIASQGDGLLAAGRLSALTNEVADAAMVRRTAEAAQVGAETKLALEAAARLLAQQTLRQSQKMEVMGQLTGGIAHDFNNIISVIVGRIEMLERLAAENSKLLEHVEVINRAAARAEKLVARLMSFARQDDAELVEVDLSVAVNGLADLLHHARGGRANLVVETAPTCPVVINPSELDNALLNLCVNARDAMPEGGTITVRTHEVELSETDLHDHPDQPPGRYAIVTLSDTGQGMSPEIAARIFEPFFTTKTDGRGTGLGLAQVYSCVSAAKGFIGLETAEGAGTTFNLYFPCHPAEK